MILAYNLVNELNLRIYYFIHKVMTFNIAGESYLVVSYRKCKCARALCLKHIFKHIVYNGFMVYLKYVTNICQHDRLDNDKIEIRKILMQ